MGRGEGQHALTPRRRQAPASNQLIFTDGHITKELAESNWGWRSNATVLWDRGGSAVIVGMAGDESVVGLILAGVANSGLSSFFETRVSSHNRDKYIERLKRIGERIILLRAGGWEVVETGEVGFGIQATGRKEPLAWKFTDWEHAQEVGPIERRRRMHHIEANLNALPLNADHYYRKEDQAATAEREQTRLREQAAREQRLDGLRQLLKQEQPQLDEEAREDVIEAAEDFLGQGEELSDSGLLLRARLQVEERERTSSGRSAGNTRLRGWLDR